MKRFIATLTTFVLLILITGVSSAQDKKPKPGPPNIEIFIEPLGGNRQPMKQPASQNGTATFPKILAGPYILGIIIIPPPISKGQNPDAIPIELAPLRLTAVVQVVEPKDAKPPTTISVTTKDGQNASAQGDGKAKVEIDKVQPPPSQDKNSTKRIELGQIDIKTPQSDDTFSERFKLRIDVDYPKPKKDDK